MSKSRAGNPQVAVAYIRVSTDEQKLGPEAQRATIEAWAAHEGVTVAAWCVDAGVSGGSEIDARPALAAALVEMRQHGAGVLVIAKRDRLARDVYIAATIERTVTGLGARVACADGVANGDTPADAFLRQILDGAAEYERALIRARTRAALAAKRARGERTGELPYGYRLAADGLHLEADDAEQLVLAEANRLRAAGLSLRAIVAEFVRSGWLSRAGRPFALTQIARLVRPEVA
ncbi:MAG: recombinase family protein [Candidatus Wallbacteria bacterium]|nr:recombinase family protein [Candidatus Wallbacteria bacterium]